MHTTIKSINFKLYIVTRKIYKKKILNYRNLNLKTKFTNNNQLFIFTSIWNIYFLFLFMLYIYVHDCSCVDI